MNLQALPDVVHPAVGPAVGSKHMHTIKHPPAFVHAYIARHVLTETLFKHATTFARTSVRLPWCAILAILFGTHRGALAQTYGDILCLGSSETRRVLQILASKEGKRSRGGWDTGAPAPARRPHR